MNVLCVIPARIGSTRLPRKMLSEIQGKPLIQHTYAKAAECQDITKVIVATDSNEIVDVVNAVGGEAILTDPDLPTGSDRVAAVAELFPDMDVVINLQGDEPFIKPKMLTELINPYKQGINPEMATLAYELHFPEEYKDPKIVKVIYDQNNFAIYFSRSPLPFFRKEITNAPVLHHMGVYAFQREFLLKFTKLQQTPLEQAESLEQLRALEHGHKIYVTKTFGRTLEINTPEELERAQQYCHSA